MRSWTHFLFCDMKKGLITMSVQAVSPGESMQEQAKEKVLPLPGWLTKVYFIFPVVLYIPDALFNYYVYSDGISNNKSANPVIQVGFVVLWSFLSVGVVGMAYLLSVLAPWHWGQGHRVQALFCGFGVVVATGITTWNSLAYRSQNFVQFQTDQWAYALWPQLQANHISVTMILVSIAPPFWGLFWAIVQPTQTGRSLRQLQESHEERLMRLQQEAELKRLRAQTNAAIREAQVRGMAQTAAAVREQASGVLAQRRNKGAAEAATDQSAHPTAQADTAADTSADTVSSAAATADETRYDGAVTQGQPNNSASSNDAAHTVATMGPSTTVRATPPQLKTSVSITDGASRDTRDTDDWSAAMLQLASEPASSGSIGSPRSRRRRTN